VGRNRRGTDYSYPEEDGMSNVGRTFETDGTITRVEAYLAQIFHQQEDGMSNVGDRTYCRIQK
jgi:hypothetical protein